MSTLTHSSPRRRLLQVGLVVVVLIVVAAYFAPRLYNLIATPYRLDQTIVSADNYNPALDTIISHEKVTMTAFDSLGEMKQAIASVQVTDARVHAELTTLTRQISDDVRVTLARANTNLGALIGELDGLTGRIDSLSGTVDGTAISLSRNRARLAAILDETRETAAKVHQTRQSADSAAADLSGQ
ncbi:hypothetical protein IU436_29720 [Nocardia farcinica]|nr:hypothetical protein [Nocardia farcinica]MBF6434499.1 hypothetical protein [Nocardia farcinica]MBF6505584.1 hypothetical protein [Nocardia farcinica]